VKCRRILLARKTITCSRQFTRAQAIEEVAHLRKLSHAHIVRVIGTYVLGRKISILLYPVAQYNLDSFLHTMNETTATKTLNSMRSSCANFFSCLSTTLKYIHSTYTKHMDIKPKNILVCGNYTGGPDQYTVFVADFGIARSYQELNATETDGPTLFTRKYAAPEVILQDRRGLSADIFSLGCVFLEMIAALSGTSTPLIENEIHDNNQTLSESYGTTILTTDVLQIFLESASDCSYHTNSTALRTELSGRGSWKILGAPVLRSSANLGELIGDMLREEPDIRPSACDLASYFYSRRLCCDVGPLGLRAHGQ
jgi:serine/threonine protein kinase